MIKNKVLLFLCLTALSSLHSFIKLKEINLTLFNSFFKIINNHKFVETVAYNSVKPALANIMKTFIASLVGNTLPLDVGDIAHGAWHKNELSCV